MKRGFIWLCLSMLLACFVQLFLANAAPEPKVMLAAVSRNIASISGITIGLGHLLNPGLAHVEPIAYLSASGKWESLPCGADRDGTQPNEKDCKLFSKQYFGKSHAYTVVSAGGERAVVHAKPSTLSECFGYAADGTYSGAAIAGVAIAASDSRLFMHVDAPKELLSSSAEKISQALSKKLHSTKWLKLFSLSLENKYFIVVKRAAYDAPEKEYVGEDSLIFVIGAMDGPHFTVLHRKENTGDEDENILGVIRLKSGREFLITSVRDPEGQWFRVYGIKDGSLKLIFSGGGSSC